MWLSLVESSIKVNHALHVLPLSHSSSCCRPHSSSPRRMLKLSESRVSQTSDLDICAIDLCKCYRYILKHTEMNFILCLTTFHAGKSSGDWQSFFFFFFFFFFLGGCGSPKMSLLDMGTEIAKSGPFAPDTLTKKQNKTKTHYDQFCGKK